jgi:hypothetical protein
MPKARPKQPTREDWLDWQRKRSAAFFKGTQRKGMPMTYGHGRAPETQKKGRR